ADEAQSSRVLVPLLEDPYEAIRQAYLVGTDAESKPFEDPIETEAPESPYTIASSTCHVEELEGSGTTACMAVRLLPAMSPSLSVSIAKVATMPDLAFRKRFRSSYDSSPSPTFLVCKRYRGTSELILDTNSEGDELRDEDDEEEEEEDAEVEESLDSDSKSEDAKDKGPTTKDEDPTVGDEGHAMGDEGPSIRVESIGLRGDEAVLEGQQRAASVMETTMDTAITEWSFGSLPISPAPSIVPLLISSPMISLTIPSLIASPATVEAERFLTELRAQVEMHEGLIRDHIVRLWEL
nr:hypothetical protein [Tanacetum cinerariifolium]